MFNKVYYDNTQFIEINVLQNSRRKEHALYAVFQGQVLQENGAQEIEIADADYNP